MGMSWLALALVAGVLVQGALVDPEKEITSLAAGCSTKGGNPLCPLEETRQGQGRLVPVGSVCRDVIADVDVICSQDGTWSVTAITDGLELREREKRVAVAAVVGIVSVVISGLSFVTDLIFRSIELANKNSPPQITCPGSKSAFARPLETSAQFLWPDPVTSDDKGIEKGPECRPKSGDTFPEGQHRVQCYVKDGDGEMASCAFPVVVQVRRCPSLTWPEDGSVTCPHGNLNGATCHLSCDEGYAPAGPTNSTCLGVYWSVPVLRCKPVGCGELPRVENGYLSCPSLPVFQTVCQVVCYRGFRLRGSGTVWCQGESGFTEPGQCVDDESPTFPRGCPGDVEEWAAPLGNLTLLSWPAPDVRDNSGRVNLTCSHDPSQGLPPGRHTLLYTATDAAGNRASCSFLITIRTLPCPPPVFDTSGRRLMTYACPSGHVVGARCSVSCRSGYPLDGPATLYCDRDDSTYPPRGRWSTQSGVHPTCRVTQCPELPPPQNGALACHSWTHGQACSMFCNDKYDIPLQALAIGHYVCGQSDGTWRPTDVVPGCTEKRQEGAMRLPSKLHYYTGSCPENATKAQIRDKAIELLRNSSSLQRCTGVPECRVDQIVVKCGPVTSAAGRRRRDVFRRSAATVEIVVDFEIRAKLPEGENGSQAVPQVQRVLTQVGTVLRQEVEAGAFNMQVEGLALVGEVLSTDRPRFTCENGTQRTGAIKCTSCAPGSYFNQSERDCRQCPLHHYEDVGFSLACKPCPQHTGTNGTGKTSLNDCLAQCRPGWMSETGLEPCQECQVGSFQPDWGQPSCQPCPPNSSTPLPAASSPSQCLAVSGCASSPCGNHTCVTVPGGWQCQCHGGWSGEDCGTPPDWCRQHQCQNGASCQSGLHNYSCLCAQGFRGDLCSIRIRNGGWSAWSNWTECSTTCGGGSMRRERSCDSPPPDPDGLACLGPSLETASCNTQQCPSCPQLPQPDGVVWNCTEEEEMTSCSVGCREGLVLALSLQSDFRCGAASNFTWNFLPVSASSQAFVPECTEPQSPDETRVGVRARLQQLPGCGDEDADDDVTKQQALQQTRLASQDLDCVRNRKCRAEVALSACPTSDPGGSDVNSTNIALVLIASASYGHINLTEDLSDTSDTSEDGTRRYVDLLTSLDRSLQQLRENPEAFFTVEVGGQQYPPSSPLAFSGGVTCPPGTVPAQGACGECPRGTRQRGVQCVLCEQGSFSESTGSTSCTACPPGLSTPGLGSTSPSHCNSPPGASVR